jgi:hypothetical protein
VECPFAQPLIVLVHSSIGSPGKGLRDVNERDGAWL